MTAPGRLPAERAREELRAARLLLDAGLPAQAVSRAWFSALHAAGAALAVSGATPASPAGVVAAFVRGMDGEDMAPHAARSLRRLFEDHKDVDYALAIPTASQAERALADAQRLVEEMSRWTESRARGATSRAGS